MSLLSKELASTLAHGMSLTIQYQEHPKITLWTPKGWKVTNFELELGPELTEQPLFLCLCKRKQQSIYFHITSTQVFEIRKNVNERQFLNLIID